MKNNNWMIVLVAVLLGACGGVPDTSDIDTHVLETDIIEFADGISVTETRDLGFNRDAYLAAVEDAERDIVEDDSAVYGTAKQAVVQTGRFGIDSQAAGAASDSRCPTAGYTGNVNINPTSFYCGVPKQKSVAWYLDASLEAWNYRFSGYSEDSENFMQNTVIPQAFARANTGTSWSNTIGASNTSPGRVTVGDAGAGAIAKMSNQWAPMVLATNNGHRVRKHQLNGCCLLVTITLDFDDMYNVPPFNLSDGSTQTQRNDAFKSIFAHEVGHSMGYGHDPSGSTNLMRAGGLGNTFYNYSSTQKSEMTAYVP